MLRFVSDDWSPDDEVGDPDAYPDPFVGVEIGEDGDVAVEILEPLGHDDFRHARILLFELDPLVALVEAGGGPPRKLVADEIVYVDANAGDMHYDDGQIWIAEEEEVYETFRFGYVWPSAGTGFVMY